MLKIALQAVKNWWIGKRLNHAVAAAIKPERKPGEGIPVSETDEGKLFIQLATTGCPDCGTSRFAEGPRGGMMTNLICENGHRFNIAPVLGIAHRL